MFQLYALNSKEIKWEPYIFLTPAEQLRYSAIMITRPKSGVLLLNLGGPQRLEDVRPFLYNLFSDRQIIRLGPSVLQKPLAWLIARRRAPKSMANYRLIGGGSPILKKTEEQAQALQRALRDDGVLTVRPCMRYWHPRAEQALLEMEAAKVEVIIALSLYPHYSIATTGSSLDDLYRTKNKLGLKSTLLEIPSWPTEPLYIACLAARIGEGIDRFHGQEVEILYSAHSLPVSFIQEGDPYVRHLEETITAVERLTGRQGRLCYQSRSGPVAWLGPSTPEVIRETAQQGGKNLLVVPLSFVSDHVETLYEIDIEYRALAKGLGLNFEMTPGLNADPMFINALRQLVITQLDS